MRVIIGVGCLMLLWIVGYYLHFLPVPEPQIYQYIAVTLIAIVQPLGIYLTIKRGYESSNHLGEKLEIETAEDKLSVKGQSFYTELLWNKLFKIVEERDHILIYENTLTAVIIDKTDLGEKELEEFKNILSSIPQVPVHLRKH
jgi:hypothetical protein